MDETQLEARLKFLEREVQLISRRITQIVESESLHSVRSELPDNNRDIFDSGDTSWMMFSTVIVLLMTLPGIALFYGGLVPSSKSFLAAGLQTLSIASVVTVLWFVIGYSISFGPNNSDHFFSIVGDVNNVWFMEKRFMSSSHPLASSIPQSVFCTFQLGFAIITAALIPGSFTDRMKFNSFLVFISLWHILVYCPVAHVNWHPAGLLHVIGVLDFAGGNVVHISSGISALVCSVIVGKIFGKGTLKPHSVIISAIGCFLLWMGWFGFNAGSAVATNSTAGNALLNTQIAAATGAFSWMVTHLVVKKERSFMAMMSGVIAGLVAITPAAGYVDHTAAFVFGVLVGPVCFFGCYIKNNFGIDDTLDAFGIHAIGGCFGGLMTGLFAREEWGGVNGALFGNPKQLLLQIYGLLFTIGWSAVVTYLILLLMRHTVGVRAKIQYNRILDSPKKKKKGGNSLLQRAREYLIASDSLDSRRGPLSPLQRVSSFSFRVLAGRESRDNDTPSSRNQSRNSSKRYAVNLKRSTTDLRVPGHKIEEEDERSVSRRLRGTDDKERSLANSTATAVDLTIAMVPICHLPRQNAPFSKPRRFSKLEPDSARTVAREDASKFDAYHGDEEEAQIGLNLEVVEPLQPSCIETFIEINRNQGNGVRSPMDMDGWKQSQGMSDHQIQLSLNSPPASRKYRGMRELDEFDEKDSAHDSVLQEIQEIC